MCGMILLFTAKPANHVVHPTVGQEMAVSKEFAQLEKESKEAEKIPSTADQAAAPKSLSQETPQFKVFFSPATDGHSVYHEVQKGDNLFRLAKKYAVTPELIERVNHLSDEKLRVGTKLKIPTVRLSILVDKSRNLLELKADNVLLKTYVVSTGENNCSPVGVFKITDKLVNPTWYKAGAVVKSGSPQNVLGTRWMGITKKGYGIHGTTEPEKLGKQVTAGCVRMRNDEVEELYALVPAGTEVTIVDKL